MARGLLSIVNNNESRIMAFLLFAFFILGLLSLSGFHCYDWDESAYLHMAKYIATGGREGFLEDIRPMLVPVMLAPLHESMYASRLFILILSAAALWLFYLIARELMPGSRISWLFPLLIAAYPTYYINSTAAMTEIPALFFHALSVYLLIKKRYMFSGAAGALSFFARHTFGIYAFIMLFAIIFIDRPGRAKDILRNMAYFAGGMLSMMPFLLVSAFLFRESAGSLIAGAFFPITRQLLDSTISPYVWVYDNGLAAYLFYVLKWSVLSLFSVVGIILLTGSNFRREMKKKSMERQYRLNIMLLLFLASSLLYITLGSPKVFIRYFLLVIPWLVYLMYFGIVQSGEYLRNHGIFIGMNSIKTRKNRIILPVFIAYCIIAAIGVIALIISSSAMAADLTRAPEKLYHEYFFALENVSCNASILTSVSQIKTQGNIVIGYYDGDYFLEKLKERDYDYVYYTTQWLPCRHDDNECLSVREQTIEHLNKDYVLYLNKTWPDAGWFNHSFLIFSRR